MSDEVKNGDLKMEDNTGSGTSNNNTSNIGSNLVTDSELKMGDNVTSDNTSSDQPDSYSRPDNIDPSYSKINKLTKILELVEFDRDNACSIPEFIINLTPSEYLELFIELVKTNEYLNKQEETEYVKHAKYLMACAVSLLIMLLKDMFEVNQITLTEEMKEGITYLLDTDCVLTLDEYNPTFSKLFGTTHESNTYNPSESIKIYASAPIQLYLSILNDCLLHEKKVDAAVMSTENEIYPFVQIKLVVSQFSKLLLMSIPYLRKNIPDDVMQQIVLLVNGDRDMLRFNKLCGDLYQLS